MVTVPGVAISATEDSTVWRTEEGVVEAVLGAVTWKKVLSTGGS